MKKLILKNFFNDTSVFLVTTILALSLIIWVIQAVNFLDFVTEDGHGLLVYFKFTVLNFPKIVSRILTFVFLIALFYQIIKYEDKNELLIFWNNGINKFKFINSIITYSFLIVILQIILGSLMSPIGQNLARQEIRESTIDFFPSLINDGKFIDTVNNLTIYVDKIDEAGNFENIILKDISNKLSENDFRMVQAKRGSLSINSQNRNLILSDGTIIEKKNDKISNLKFENFNFDLNKFGSKSTTYPKIQETSNTSIIKCLILHHKNYGISKTFNDLVCEKNFIDIISQEFLKRFIKPFYIPLLALFISLIIFFSKEDRNYFKIKIFLFCVSFSTIIFSEIFLRYSGFKDINMLVFIFFPLVIFLATYALTYIKTNYK